jgi:hypothetical protein
MIVYIQPMSLAEWDMVWRDVNIDDYGLIRSFGVAQNAGDLEDFDHYKVINKQKFFLAAIQHGFKYQIIIDDPS